VLEVFQNFKYHRTFLDDTKGSIVLEFSAMIGADQLKGVRVTRLFVIPPPPPLSNPCMHPIPIA
jgi:hypothetical protein